MAREYAHHTLDVYGVEVYATATPKGWKQIRRQGLRWLDKDAPQSAGQAEWAVWKPNKGLERGHLVLWVDAANHDEPGDLIDSAAHEATHGAGRIMEWVGHQPHAGDEPHAYLVGWLTRWLWEHVRATNAHNPHA